MKPLRASFFVKEFAAKAVNFSMKNGLKNLLK